MTRDEFEELLERLNPQLSDEFVRTIGEHAESLSISDIERAIETGDLSSLIAIASVNRETLAPVASRIFEAYGQGGLAEGALLNVQFDVRSSAAEEWSRQHAASLVTRINREQRDAIRIALESGVSAGNNPRQTALDIVGRLNRETKRRQGGIVGLTRGQADYVRNARSELLSGDPSLLGNYLTRKRRDARFDGVVRRALEAGQPVGRNDANRILGRYADRLLKLRGDMIARTENTAALNASRLSAWAQGVAEGQVAGAIKRWHATGDARTREDHADMHGRTAALGEAFRSPSGAQLLYPGDASLGAGAADLVNCRCYMGIRNDNSDLIG